MINSVSICEPRLSLGLDASSRGGAVEFAVRTTQLVMNKNLSIATVTLNPAIDQTVRVGGFTTGRVNTVKEDRSHPGGKGVNVASALSDYGFRVVVTGFLGRDNASSFEALFTRKGIDDRFVRIPGRTRVGIKITDPILNETTDINFPGPPLSPGDAEQLAQRIAGIEAEWFVLAGSLPPGLPVTIYRDLTRSLKARGCKVAVDASGAPLALALDARPDLIKPNVHELEAMVGIRLQDEQEVIEAARGLVARGVGLVVVSMGPDGACYVTLDQSLVARPYSVKVLSTVGAGDAMVAGTLAGRLHSLCLADTARMGTAFSLEAITRIESGISSPETIEQSMARISIK